MVGQRCEGLRAIRGAKIWLAGYTFTRIFMILGFLFQSGLFTYLDSSGFARRNAIDIVVLQAVRSQEPFRALNE
jgi:hypothetical protein